MTRFSRREMLYAGGSAAMLAALPGWASARPLEIAYRNARLWTGVAKAPVSDAIGVSGNRIVAVGEAAVRAASGKATRVVDLKGAFVMPSFIDPHTHFLRGAAMLSQPSLRDAATPAEFTRRIGEAAKALPKGKWLEGGNWDEQLWGGELPRKDWIDAVTPDTPVAVTRLDLHMYLCNSLALKLAGITRDTPDPPGGVIVRDANGEPTGIVKDAAKDLIDRAIPSPSDAEIEATIEAGARYALSKGVTQVHCTELDWITHKALRRMRGRGPTLIRFYSFVPLKDWEKMAAEVAADGRGDDWVRWGALKGLMDGSLGSRTALFRDPYTDAPDSHGIALDPPEKMEEWIGHGDAAGLHVTTHAIGDLANRELLDIYARVAAKNGARDRRFRIEHAQHLDPADIPRFARQGVLASVQPYHAIDDGRWAVKRIGPDRLHGTYAFHSLIASGARVNFGSDWPVAPLDPLTGVEAAVLRRTIDGANPGGWLPEERVTVEQALHAYTATNAYAGFQEDRLGRLAPGMIADFVVLDADLTAIDPAKITSAKILRTIINGREAFATGD
ncbi:MAG: amidohydrolase [Novosphingobium sp.]|nr:amidohydrolase [Novosphingobium sp.]